MTRIFNRNRDRLATLRSSAPLNPPLSGSGKTVFQDIRFGHGCYCPRQAEAHAIASGIIPVSRDGFLLLVARPSHNPPSTISLSIGSGIGNSIKFKSSNANAFLAAWRQLI